MRGSALILVSVLALATAGCAPREQKPPAAPPPTAAEPPAPAPASAPETAPAPAAPIVAEPAPAAPEPTVAPQPPTAPPPPEIVHFSPADYAAHERRVSALINNAESRDTSGETVYVAEQGRTQRQRCATRACIERSYAEEEARLRKWEGSNEIK